MILPRLWSDTQKATHAQNEPSQALLWENGMIFTRNFTVVAVDECGNSEIALNERNTQVVKVNSESKIRQERFNLIILINWNCIVCKNTTEHRTQKRNQWNG